MNEKAISQIMSRIRSVVHHVGTFERSYPRILKGTREYTRSHLVVMRESLPDLKRLLRYVVDTMPSVARMTGWADRGVADLVKASSMLHEIRSSTERAVTEIFQVLDHLDPLLEQAAQAEEVNGQTRQNLTEARDQLLLITNSLQFQDITAQQIEATNALLRDLSGGLVTLVEGLGVEGDELPTIEVREGTYDPNAHFDRERANVDQVEIDRLVGEAPESTESDRRAPEAPEDTMASDCLVAAGTAMPEASAQAAVEEPGSNGGTVSQDDIDALLNG